MPPKKSKKSKPRLPRHIHANFETARKLIGDMEAARIWGRANASWPDILPIVVPNDVSTATPKRSRKAKKRS